MNVKSKQILVLGLLMVLSIRTVSAGMRPKYKSKYVKRYDNNKQQSKTRFVRRHVKMPIDHNHRARRKLETEQEGKRHQHHEKDEDNTDIHHDEDVDHEHEDDSEIDEAHIEYEEVKAAVALVEFKLTEVNELIKECIEEEFAANMLVEKEVVLKECAGMNFQIMLQNYKEAMRRVKQIFLDILRKKTKNLDEEYEEEIDFFLDTLEDFANKDFKLKESLEISREATKYYVSPHFYDDLVKIAEPELRAFNAIHHRFHKNRKEVQDLVKKKIEDREEYIHNYDEGGAVHHERSYSDHDEEEPEEESYEEPEEEMEEVPEEEVLEEEEPEEEVPEEEVPEEEVPEEEVPEEELPEEEGQDKEEGHDEEGEEPDKEGIEPNEEESKEEGGEAGGEEGVETGEEAGGEVGQEGEEAGGEVGQEGEEAGGEVGQEGEEAGEEGGETGGEEAGGEVGQEGEEAGEEGGETGGEEGG